jgi:hypothetical protein
MSLVDHGRELIEDISHYQNWVDWDALKDAAGEIAGLLFVVVLIAFFPVTIPLVAWLRMHYARKQFRQEIARQERVNRMQSRVQKRGILFRCVFCGKEHDTVEGCNVCEETHQNY